MAYLSKTALNRQGPCLSSVFSLKLLTFLLHNAGSCLKKEHSSYKFSVASIVLQNIVDQGFFSSSCMCSLKICNQYMQIVCHCHKQCTDYSAASPTTDRTCSSHVTIEQRSNVPMLLSQHCELYTFFCVFYSSATMPSTLL